MKWLKNPLLIFNLVLIILLFFIFFYRSGIIGTDIFYHLKVSELFQQKGFFFDSFPWQQFSVVSQLPADLSLGFHLVLTLLLYLFPKILALKILNIGLIAILANFFLFFLKKEKVSWPYFWTTLLFLSSWSFLYRLFTYRPYLVAIILSLLIVYLISRQKYWWLALTALAFVIFYSGWVQVLFIAFFYTLARLIMTKKIDWKPMAFSMLGLIIGNLVRPDFPNYFLLAYKQTFGLIFSNFQNSLVNTPVELGPLNFGLVVTNFIIFLAFVLAWYLSLNLKKISHQKKALIYALALLASFYGVMTFRMIRFMEYFVPFTVLWLALATHAYLAQKPENYLKLKSTAFKKFIKKPLNAVGLGLISLCFIIYPFQRLFGAINNASDFNRYRQTAEWLSQNTPAGTVVFNTSWDSFARLFYFNQQNYYLVGMEPAFMYFYNPKLYWLWHNISHYAVADSSGEAQICSADLCQPQKIAAVIKNIFRSDFIWLNDNPNYQNFKKFLDSYPDYFQKKIETGDSSVYQIISNIDVQN